jgi:hypothetical protein
MPLLRIAMSAENSFVLGYAIDLGAKSQETMKKHCKVKLGYDSFPAVRKARMLGTGSTDPTLRTFAHQNREHDYYFHDIDTVIGGHILSKAQEAETSRRSLC